MKPVIKYSGLIIALFFMAYSCTKKTPTPEELVDNLNGFWKIHQVKGPDGKIKEYKVSTTIDYIEIDSSLRGIRRKVQPQLDSTFVTTNSIEEIEIIYAADSIKIHYKTPVSEWSEFLISSTEDAFSVKNKQGKVYTYKRFENLKKELEKHGQ